MARVLVTRAPGRGEALAETLRAAGVEVVEVALVAFEATGVCLPDPRPSDWLLFSSATPLHCAMEAVAPALRVCGRVAAVGPATAAALRLRGREPACVPAEALGRRLVEAMGDLQGQRVLYPRAEDVPPELEDALRAAGAELVSAPVYRTICPAGAPAALRAALPVDVIALASGSAARHLVATGVPLGGARVAVIGPSTAEVARDLGLRVDAEAEPHTGAGLASAVLGLIRRGASSGPS